MDVNQGGLPVSTCQAPCEIHSFSAYRLYRITGSFEQVLQVCLLPRAGQACELTPLFPIRKANSSYTQRTSKAYAKASMNSLSRVSPRSIRSR